MRKKLNKNKKENKMSLNVLMLESVGSCIDTDNVIHPLNIDGTPDMYDGMSTHVDDCIDGEWLGSLSSGDSSAMNEWVLKNNKEKK